MISESWFLLFGLTSLPDWNQRTKVGDGVAEDVGRPRLLRRIGIVGSASLLGHTTFSRLDIRQPVGRGGVAANHRRWRVSELLEHLQWRSQLHGPLKGAAAIVDSIAPQDFLSFSHYLKTCPDVEAIIHRKLNYWVQKDNTLAAAIIRLHFHDCAVRGCDASILLNHAGSERRAEASKTLRGFQVIDDIKSELEKRCPKTVSCADILTAAARDSTILVGGPFWEVPFGRKDGRISIAKDANSVPHGRENVTALIGFFAARGLDVLDLVTLSGSHTIGRSTCQAIQHRLSNVKRDPSLNVNYYNYLKKKCTNQMNYVHLDVTTPRTFDTVYYNNLGKKMGLLSTDEAIYFDARTTPFVSAFTTQPSLFINQFAVSMVKLGNVGVLTRKNEGEIRRNCSVVNY